MLYVTGVFLKDITKTIFVNLLLNVSRLSVCCSHFDNVTSMSNIWNRKLYFSVSSSPIKLRLSLLLNKMWDISGVQCCFWFQDFTYCPAVWDCPPQKKTNKQTNTHTHKNTHTHPLLVHRKLWKWQMEFYLFIPLSVALTILNGHGDVKQPFAEMVCLRPTELKLCTSVTLTSLRL